jgi:CheY-like chemotaxis protein
MDREQCSGRGGAGLHASAPILVVEDDPHTRQVVRWTLEDLGLPVVTAAGDERPVRIGG